MTRPPALCALVLLGCLASASGLGLPRAPPTRRLRTLAMAATAPRPVEAQPSRTPLNAQSRVLVVGASRGLGAEFVRQLLERGCKVVATVRNPLLPTELEKHPQLSVVQMDLGDAESVRACAAAQCEAGPPFTHIVHNAGVYGKTSSLAAVTAEEMMEVFRINSVGPTLVAQAFTKCLAEPQDGGRVLPILAMVSSKVGSVEDNRSGGGYSYRASKSAANIVAKSLSIDLNGKCSVVLLHPGYVRTAMTNFAGLIDADQSVEGMLGAIEATDATVPFRWVDWKKELIPW